MAALVGEVSFLSACGAGALTTVPSITLMRSPSAFMRTRRPLPPSPGSFTETLSGWAEAVVTGRARLGGIPVGIVATEGRLREKKCPADPADVSSHERIVQQVRTGCIWVLFLATARGSSFLFFFPNEAGPKQQVGWATFTGNDFD